MSMDSLYHVVLLLLLVTKCCKGFKDDKHYKDCCISCQCSGVRRRNFTIDCANQNLTEVPSCPWSHVKELKLSGNKIRNISKDTLYRLRNLRKLDLSDNQLGFLPEPNVTMENLRELDLELNNFTAIPSSALSKMPKLRKVVLSFNQIEEISKNTFNSQRKLLDLLLHSNKLKYIDPEFLGSGGKNLVQLDLSKTEMEKAPFESIRKLKKLSILKLCPSKLKEVPDLAFKGLENLYELCLDGCSKLTVGSQAFSYLPKLHKLSVISNGLKDFPNLTGTHSLSIIEMPTNEIQEIPENLCDNLKGLEDINLNHNHLTRLPRLTNCTKLIILKMDHNLIEDLGNSLQGLKDLLDLSLKGNRIKSISQYNFVGLQKLETLYLGDNRITKISKNAFSSFTALLKLDLSKNNFPVLPTAGLKTIQYLSVKGNTKLTRFPASDSFPQINTLEVEYPYHCCPFKERTENTDIHSSSKVEFNWLEFGSGYGTDDDESMNATDEEDSEMPNEPLPTPTHVKCTPKPDPFFPCQDLMGDWILRCGVWIVFLLALIGNATVIVVILASHTKMDVSRFLISNLAFADLFMGVYLGFLAVVDVSTFGNFKRYALEWQMSAGCRTAGFLAVLSSELSVFTLTVITLERYIAIKNAIRVNRKLELKTAMIVMAFGWIFAIASASLPLLHINSYSKFSICLPFEIENTQSIAFLSLLLCLNATAFVVILCCYILMYCSIRGSNAWNASDFRVAKRMALLVFTDFACWAPIVFLSLTAAFGSTLVSLNQAKIFTVFVFPLNSCANPFLYAIFTSHFKKDVVSICRRVEDKYPFLKITRHKQSFSRRSSYSGAISENPNVHLKLRRLSLPTFIRGIHSSVETHDKGGSSASTNSNNKSMETNALIQHTIREVAERETSV